jgi:hypothetical protein
MVKGRCGQEVRGRHRSVGGDRRASEERLAHQLTWLELDGTDTSSSRRSTALGGDESVMV